MVSDTVSAGIIPKTNIRRVIIQENGEYLARELESYHFNDHGYFPNNTHKLKVTEWFSKNCTKLYTNDMLYLLHTWLSSGVMYPVLGNSDAFWTSLKAGSIKAECSNSLTDGLDTDYWRKVRCRYKYQYNRIVTLPTEFRVMLVIMIKDKEG